MVRLFRMFCPTVGFNLINLLGGYLSLLLLAHHPRIFKMCLAGAPVTCWELYDSAYTERYLGLPSSSDAGYTQGRVLEWVEQFPDQ